MFEKKNASLVLGAANLVALVTPMVQAQMPAIADQNVKAEQIRQASLQSIESTWLKVSASCKARGFNADPAAIKYQKPAAHAQLIYGADHV